MPGQELGTLIAVVAVGLLVFVPLVIYLSIKVGIKPTLAWLTIGLWPRGHPDSQEDADVDNRRHNPEKDQT